MNRKIVALIVLGLVLLASLLACGYFGVKAVRRTRLRRSAMSAYENGDYASAERLLRLYVRQDPDAEKEFAALAAIYHEFGNAGMEAQMWQQASSLNPLNPEYRENMLNSAVKSASYVLLHGTLGRKARLDEPFTDQELYLYIISSCRSGYRKDAEDAYRKAAADDPEAFRRSEPGRLAEFMAKYPELSEAERDDYLSEAMHSEDPVIRFEALYTDLRRVMQRGGENGEIEALLKRIAETNHYAGTPLLADYYFSKCRFADAIGVLGPYLNTIDDGDLYLLYAESCVFEEKKDELAELEKKLRGKTDSLLIVADYCDVLTAFMENDEEKLAAAARKTGKLVDSPLFRLIRLRVALANKSFGEIRTVAQEIFSAPPFHDLHNRALVVCMDYISGEMKTPKTREDLSRMADLARILSGYLHGNRLLTEIILSDQYGKGLAKESDLTAALAEFPDDALLLRITAEYLLLNGKPEQALALVEQVLADPEAAEQNPVRGIRFLHMLALDQLGRHDEAAAIFRELVEQSEFDLELLARYFQFCESGNRIGDLTSMADRLDSVKDRKLEHFGKFFRAAALLATNDEGKRNEALALLASTPNDDPEFTLYAANKLCKHDRLDEAETKYNAILKSYRNPSPVYVNLSIVYHAKGEDRMALEAAKTAFELEKNSMLPAFIYAKRLSEAGRYGDAVDVLKFPRHAVNYREDIVELWCGCMRHVIETSMAEQKYLQAENQCKHLLVIAPGDEFGVEALKRIREKLFPKKDNVQQNGDEFAPAAPAF